MSISLVILYIKWPFPSSARDAQNLPKKTRSGCGSVHYKYFTKSGHYQARPGDCPKSPQNCRAAPKKPTRENRGSFLDEWFQIGQNGACDNCLIRRRVSNLSKLWVSNDPRIWGSAIFEFNWNIFKYFMIIQTNRKVLRDFKRLRVVWNVSMLHMF